MVIMCDADWGSGAYPAILASTCVGIHAVYIIPTYREEGWAEKIGQRVICGDLDCGYALDI